MELSVKFYLLLQWQNFHLNLECPMILLMHKNLLCIWVLHNTAHLSHIGFSAHALCAVSNNAGASSAKVGMSRVC